MLALLLLVITGAELSRSKNQTNANGTRPFPPMRRRQELLGAKSNMLHRNDTNIMYANPFQQARQKNRVPPGTSRNVPQGRKKIAHPFQSLGWAIKGLNTNETTNKSHARLNRNRTQNVTGNNTKTRRNDFAGYIKAESEKEYENYTKQKKRKNVNILFKDYMRKFEMTRVIEKIRPQTSNLREQFMLAADMIDPMDELLNLKIDPINPNPFNINASRRSWRPSGNYGLPLHIDRNELRPRLVFLIQQSIYQTRDSMINMQEMREKYRQNQVYKMGYLTARADHLGQLFSGVAFKIFFSCASQIKSYHDPDNREYNRLILYEHYDAEERLLNHWYECILLRELIQANHFEAMRIVKKYNKTGSKKWFED